jgi:FG-GAP repeat
MRRIAAVGILVAGGLWLAAYPMVRGSTAAQAAPARSLQSDFDNNGRDDLAVGVPGEDVGAQDAGVLNVLYSSSRLTGLGQQFSQVSGAVEPGDAFGDAVAAGDFNNDGFADVAVGAPFETVNGLRDAGAVSTLYGSPSGLTITDPAVPGGLFTQDRTGGNVEADDAFGDAVAAGDFNNDGFADLAIGAPFEDVQGRADAGAVSVMYGSTEGIQPPDARLFTQPVSAVEVGDSFGFSLGTGDFDQDGFVDLAVGAPFENVGRAPAGGAVSVLYGSTGGLTASGARTFTQPVSAVEADDSFGFSVTAGDFNQDGYGDLATGAPFEDVGSRVDAGAVSTLYGSIGGLTTSDAQTFTQPVSAPEADDSFGWAVTSGDFNGNGIADLVASAPFEDIGAALDAGAVSALYGMPGGLATSGAQTFHQDSPGTPGVAETGDVFGGSVAAGDGGPTAAASPSEGASSAQRGPAADAAVRRARRYDLAGVGVGRGGIEGVHHPVAGSPG